MGRDAGSSVSDARPRRGRPEAAGRLKMREWKMREQIARVENVGVSPMDRQSENKFAI